MSLNEVEQHKSQLVEILEEMDLPEMRKNLNESSNLRWLMRNLRVRNRKHTQCKEALEIIKNLMKGQW
jgi:hypothetical protein